MSDTLSLLPNIRRGAIIADKIGIMYAGEMVEFGTLGVHK